MKDITTKIIAGVILTAGSAFGTYTLTENNASAIQKKLDNKTILLESKQNEKILTGRDYIYSQLTSGRTPNLSTLSTEEMAQAYIEAYYANEGKETTDALIAKLKSGKQVNVGELIKLSAKKKGELLNCK